MIKSSVSLAIAASLLSACGLFSSFGSAPDETKIAASEIIDSNDPLASRAYYLAGTSKFAYLSTGQVLSVTAPSQALFDVAAERRYDGFILRGKTLGTTTGHHSPILVRDPEAYAKDPANPVFLVRLTPPEFPSPKGTATNREVLFGGYLGASDVAGMNSVTLASASNRVVLRLR